MLFGGPVGGWVVTATSRLRWARSVVTLAVAVAATLALNPHAKALTSSVSGGGKTKTFTVSNAATDDGHMGFIDIAFPGNTVKSVSATGSASCYGEGSSTASCSLDASPTSVTVTVTTDPPFCSPQTASIEVGPLIGSGAHDTGSVVGPSCTSDPPDPGPCQDVIDNILDSADEDTTLTMKHFVDDRDDAIAAMAAAADEESLHSAYLDGKAHLELGYDALVDELKLFLHEVSEKLAQDPNCTGLTKKQKSDMKEAAKQHLKKLEQTAKRDPGSDASESGLKPAKDAVKNAYKNELDRF